jgi:hypothetical protein
MQSLKLLEVNVRIRLFAGVLAALLASVATAAPTCFVGSNTQPPTAVVSFVAPTLQSDGTPFPAGTVLTYNLYQGTASGAEVKVASGLGPNSPITISTGLTSGQTVYWYLTAVDSGGEGLPSNEACKLFPAAVPGTFVITIK